MQFGVATVPILFAVASPVSAMTVQEFVTRGDALQAKGAMALFSSDLDALRAEFHPGLVAWRAQVATARPPVCAPAKIRLEPDEILMLLKQVPVAERAQIDVRSATVRELNARYRCR